MICNVSAAISLQDLRRDFGDRPALAGVSAELGAGETLAVLGPNGSGKTTLLRVLAGLLRPSGGSASVLGHAIPAEAWRLRGRIGYLGHEALLYRDLTARENLLFHARLHGLDAVRAEERIAFLLGLLGMDRRADDRIDTLSAGMRQRIAVCRCALHEPDLLLLDEPDSNLDAEGRELARQAVGRESGATRVIVSHDRDRALAEADRVLVLAAGGTVEHLGPATEGAK
jgi:ABC-type multidrug transport system ATPase subunit